MPKTLAKSRLLLLAALLFPATAFSQLSLEPLSDWGKRVRVGGELAVEFSKGQGDSQRANPKPGFAIQQFRPVMDAEVYENISVLWEANVVDEGEFQTADLASQLYVRLDNLANYEWLNAKVGKFATPFGEEYVFTLLAFDNPLISHTVIFPYGEDTGLQFFGSTPNDKFHYVVAAMNGAAMANGGTKFQSEGQLSYGGKIWVTPWGDAFEGMLSAYTTGKRGTQIQPGATAFEISDVHFDGFTNEVTVNAYQADMVFRRANWGRLWIYGGIADVHRPDPAMNSRKLSWYSAEVTHDFTPKFYAAARWSWIHSQIKNGVPEILNASNGWEDFPVDRVNRLSAGFGYRLSEHAVVKAEYSADGAGYAQPVAVKARKDYFVAQLAVRF